MSPWLAIVPAALCALRLRRPASPVLVLPEPVPPDWQAIEPRWDCQTCRSVQAAEVHDEWFRCLRCGIETPTAYA